MSALGLDAKQVAVMTNCDVRTVKHWAEHYETTGSIKDDPGRGRKKITTETQDDNIVRSAQETPLTTPRIIRSRLELDVSARTIRRRLDEAGLYGRVARMEYPFTDEHIEKRRAFALAHLDWTVDEWNRVIYADEAFICLGASGQVWVQRPQDTAWVKEYMVDGIDGFAPKIGIFGSFTHAGVGPMQIYDCNMDKYYYRSILNDSVYAYANQKYGEKGCYYLHDNAPYAKANVVKWWFKGKQIERLEMPPYSPDVNPTENLWAVLKRQIDARAPKTIEELTKITREEWLKLDPTFCDKLVQSMPNRMQAIVDAEGYKTRY